MCIYYHLILIYTFAFSCWSFWRLKAVFSFQKTGGKKSFKYIFWKCVQIFADLNRLLNLHV